MQPLAASKTKFPKLVSKKLFNKKLFSKNLIALIATSAAAAATLLLFMGLGWIIQGPSSDSLGEKPERLSMNWVKVVGETSLETLKPPPPPPPPPPPANLTPSPNTNQAASSNLAQSLDATAVNLPAPNLDGIFDASAPVLGNLGLDASADLPVYREAPAYPPQAMSRRIEGWVELEFEVDEKGQVVAETVRVLDAQPKNIFNRSAIRSIARWKFAAYELAPGQNRKLRQRLEFKLGDR